MNRSVVGFAVGNKIEQSSRILTIGDRPRYVNSQPSNLMKNLAEEDIHNRKVRMENDKEYSVLGEESDGE